MLQLRPDVILEVKDGFLLISEPRSYTRFPLPLGNADWESLTNILRLTTVERVTIQQYLAGYIEEDYDSEFTESSSRFY